MKTPLSICPCRGCARRGRRSGDHEQRLQEQPSRMVRSSLRRSAPREDETQLTNRAAGASPPSGEAAGVAAPVAPASMEALPCCSVRFEPAGGSIGAVLWARVERDSGVWRGSVHRVDHGLKHRQAVGRQANASADHHAVVSLGLEPPFHVEVRPFHRAEAGTGPRAIRVRPFASGPR